MSAYWVIPVAIGFVFLLFGIALIIWGCQEGTNYYDSLINGFDLRNFSHVGRPSGSRCVNYRGMDCYCGWVSSPLSSAGCCSG